MARLWFNDVICSSSGMSQLKMIMGKGRSDEEEGKADNGNKLREKEKRQ